MPDALPDDDLDLDDMGTLELQRERTKVQRALGRAAVEQRDGVKRIERYSLITMLGVLGNGAIGVVQDPPNLPNGGGATDSVQQAIFQLGLWILGLLG